MIDRHYCNIPKTKGGLICLNFVTFLRSPCSLTDAKKALLERRCFTDCMPLLTPTTVWGHVIVLRPFPLPPFFEIQCESSSGGQECWNFQECCFLKSHWTPPLPKHAHTHTHTYIYTYVYLSDYAFIHGVK